MSNFQKAREKVTMLNFNLIMGYMGVHHYISYSKTFRIKEV